MKLPRTLDDLAGLRAARWIRESTSGQFDAFGPDAQREQQDRAIARWELVDTGLAWQVAHSGRTVGTRAEFAEMMAVAGVEYDVLVVGYVSRFARDLRTAVNARHELHAAGAAILFADERILTSDDDAWESWAREAVEAESYSRKLARRIREGYAAKRRRLGEPGGRPPYGFVRQGRPPTLVVDADARDHVVAAYAAASAGVPDREVARAVGLPIDTVRGILTNPIYVGRLRDGSKAAVDPVVDAVTWERVQALRHRRRTREPGRPVRRGYALKLRCAACDRALFGMHGRYRHPSPTCPDFLAARPRVRRAFKNASDRRVKGHSYPMAWYEGAVQLLLEEAAGVDDATLAAVVARYNAGDVLTVDELATRRIEREREEAAKRLARDRDVGAWQATMARLDAEEEAARQPVDRQRLTPAEVRAYITDLPRLWADAPKSRQQLALALFDRLAVLGADRMEFEWSREATDRGLADVVAGTLDVGARLVDLVGARGFEPFRLIDRTPPRVVPALVGSRRTA